MLPALQRQQIMFRIYVVHQVSCDKKQLLKVFITSDWPNNSYGGSIQCFSVYITIQKNAREMLQKIMTLMFNLSDSGNLQQQKYH